MSRVNEELLGREFVRPRTYTEEEVAQITRGTMEQLRRITELTSQKSSEKKICETHCINIAEGYCSICGVQVDS